MFYSATSEKVALLQSAGPKQGTTFAVSRIEAVFG